MSDPTALEHYMYLNGINTKLNYDDCFFCDRQHQPMTLVELCAEKLVSDRSLLASIHTHPIPTTLISLLMSVALSNNRLLSVQFLLDHWPIENFKLELPPSIKTWEIFFLNRSEKFRRLTERFYTAAICTAKRVASWLKHGSERKISYFDLSVMPLSNSLVEAVCLAAVEGSANRKRGTPILKQKHNFKIKVTCRLTRPPLQKMIMLLQEAKSNANHGFELIFHGLLLSGEVFCPQLFHLLALINWCELKVISCRHCYLASNSKFLFDFLSFVRTCHFLEGFDMSYTGLDYIRNPNVVLELSRVLQACSHLRRLDLSNCRLESSLELLLSKLYDEYFCRLCCTGSSSYDRGELQHLGIAWCFLQTIDLQYLTNSPHAKTLVYLNLSGNKMPTEYAIPLFMSCVKLKFLELARCVFEENDARKIFQGLYSMPNLRYLNINSCNIMNELNDLIGPKFVNMPNLKVLV